MDPPSPQFQTTADILKEAISIFKQSPRTFYLINLTLVCPLSFAILAHSLFTFPLVSQFPNSSQWTKLFILQFFYLIFLFAFSLLSTAASVFTVASLYTSKPVSFSSAISAIPPIFRRLFTTFLWVSLTMHIYYITFLGFLLLLIEAIGTQNVGLIYFSMIVLLGPFLVVHVYVNSLWHLASVVSVLEPVYGSAAMRKSFELLKGRTRMAAVLVFGYLVICGGIHGLFVSVVVVAHDWDYGMFVRIVVGGILVGVLAFVNLVGLLVQSVFYYACKSYHHQEIDKTALYDHLGGYLGEYLPLISNVQMENLDG